MASDIWNISNMNEIRNIRANIPLHFLFLKHLQGINYSFVTIVKSLSNEIGETFCEGFRWMGKFFEKSGQKYLEKPNTFSKSSRYFIIELALGNSHWFCLTSF